jgi:hypothetical protein
MGLRYVDAEQLRTMFLVHPRSKTPAMICRLGTSVVTCGS